MKTMTPDLKAHWAETLTTIATCWRLDLTDGTTMGFTDHDKAILYDGVLYEADTGFVPTAFEQSGDMSVDGMDVEAFLSSDSISADDIAAGRYDKAEIRVFKINWADTSMGILKIQRGWVGEISRQDKLFIAEMRSLTQVLQQRIGREYLGSCDATLGDSRCKVNLASFTVTGSVTSVASAVEFTDTSRAEADGYFDYGLLTFTSGNNAGRSMEVKTQVGGTFTLFQSLPAPISVGDAYSVYAGCDKMLTTCRDTFNNVDNNRGFPYIPGRDKVNLIG